MVNGFVQNIKLVFYTTTNRPQDKDKIQFLCRVMDRLLKERASKAFQ